jgi:hypothetical protein
MIRKRGMDVFVQFVKLVLVPNFFYKIGDDFFVVCIHFLKFYELQNWG